MVLKINTKVRQLLFRMPTRPLRRVKDVRGDARELNIEIGWKVSRLLTFLSREAYESLWGRMRSFKEVMDFSKLLIDRPQRLEDPGFISRPDEFLPDEFLKDQIKGNVLDLKNLEIKLAQFGKHGGRSLFSPPVERQAMVDRGAKPDKSQRSVTPLGVRAREYEPERLWHGLQTRFPIIGRKKFRDRLSGRVVPLEIMELREPHKNIVDEALMLDLIACKKEISRRAWEKNVGIEISGYTDEYVEKHFMRIDREFLLYDPQAREIVAFCGMNRLSGKEGLTVYVLEVSMIKPEYQNMRISSTLVSRLIIDAFIANRLNPITIAGRTANPQVLGAMLALSDCCPNPLSPGALPTEQQRKVFGLVADFLNPGEQKNEMSSVIHDVYPLATGLMVPPEKIPDYSKDPGVKALCEKLLRYERHNRPDFFPGELDSTDLESIISSLNIMMDAQLIRSGEEAVENAFNTAILGFTGFYDKIKPKLDGVELDPFVLSLIKLTEEDRKVDFDRLNQKKQHIIMSMNRMLLEALFPSLPRRAAKAMIAQGVVTIQAKRAFEKKQRKIRMQNWLLAQMHRFVNQ